MLFQDGADAAAAVHLQDTRDVGYWPHLHEDPVRMSRLVQFRQDFHVNLRSSHDDTPLAVQLAREMVLFRLNAHIRLRLVHSYPARSEIYLQHHRSRRSSSG